MTSGLVVHAEAYCWEGGLFTQHTLQEETWAFRKRAGSQFSPMVPKDYASKTVSLVLLIERNYYLTQNKIATFI